LTDSGGYLQRLRIREACLRTKRSAVFAQVAGAALFLVFGFKRVFGAGGPDWLWLSLALAGLLLFLAGVVIPSSTAPLEQWVVRLTRHIGEFLFRLFLTLAFFAIIAPIGLFMRIARGSSPFFAWQDGQTSAAFEGWTPKTVVADHRRPELHVSRASLLAQPALVLRYFVRHGHYFLVPVLLLLVSFGLLLFFVQSSSLAPFIYTLF